jgi:S-DNA-T family DNA segregation ATPase FtsK/SpoIIIE
MARKKKAAKESDESPFGLSEGVQQSIVAVFLGALAVIFLLSFFDLAGKFGLWVDGVLAGVFGWDRWLFDIVLLLLGWSAVSSNKRMLSHVNVIGLALFFIAFNGLLNMLLVDDPALDGALANAGGYIGLLISSLGVTYLGFWGSFVLSVACLLIAIFLIFNVSFASIKAVHEHLTNLGRLAHDRVAGDDGDDDDREERIDHDERAVGADPGIGPTEEVEAPEAEEEIESPTKQSKPAGEQVMTTRRRRKADIPFDLLDDKSSNSKPGDIERSKEIIRKTLEQFGIDVEMAEVKVGPTVAQYALRPAQGVKLARIIALQNDLALALAAHPIRIEAPIPGRSLVGIEVPNLTIGRVCLRELLESEEFKSRKTDFTAPLGKDVSGSVQMVSIDKAPHMLVAGATGSGKSVCLNDIIVSLLYQNGPDDLKLIMVDPKRVELGIYAGIPHLLVPPITKADEAINALKWAVREMERRLDHLAKFGARDIDAYNAKAQERMPKIVVIIDELADLMSQNKRDVEALIVRIAQMARAAGIHLVLATQRPSVDVITGTIKANIPTRLAFAVASQVDSKTILDVGGAEKLLGRGDMLMSTPELSKPKRAQGAYLSDKEIERVVEFLKAEGEPDYNYQVTEDARTGGTVLDSSDSDPLLDEAVGVVIDSGKASTSYLQRRMKIGYSRAARIIDLMEQMGVVGPGEGAKPREILVDSWPPASEEEEEIVDDQEDDQPSDDDVPDDEEDDVMEGRDDEIRR